MTTLHQDVRAALVKRAATAAGYPAEAQRAEEGVKFSPTEATPWVRHTLVTSSERPASVGTGGQSLHQGLFQVNLSVPLGSGTSQLDSILDAVRAVFRPGLTLQQGDATLRIRYSERGPTINSENWLTSSVVVGWTMHTNTN